MADVLPPSFYGITSVQTYLYFQRSKKDHIFMKLLVNPLLLPLDPRPDEKHTSLDIYIMNLSSIVWSVQANYLSGVLSDVIAMAIYVYRLVRVAYVARKYKITYTVFICILMAVYFSSGVAVVGVSTDSMIQILVTYTIDTCIITSALTVAVIIIWGVAPANFAYLQMAVSALLPETMLNSLLALLNSREYIRRKGEVGTVSIHLSRLRHPGPESVQDGSLQFYSKDEETLVRDGVSSRTDSKTFEGGRSLI
ncbi:hypothetical protein NM688_g2541 [Phlebia brevispora]|uniref:Uncharacterized protein n=1 Tax=Phlebia brevispora TaxID=194682 RepID=A0ACC1T8F9_9APHY|nr:hypothetical protein NM688_g2541 [Phlebia brevispora]